MTDADIARAVEAAPLRAMSSLDIDDVYTLMDVQLRERPGPRELYKRWEKQHWSAFDIDFSKDAQDWALLPPLVKDQLVWAFHAFFLGEAAVTDTLSPMVHAAPTAQDRQFLSTQLVDEARHTIFFERFFAEAMGVAGLDAAKRAAADAGYTSDLTRGYGKVFYSDLIEVTEAVRLDPADYGKWVDSIVLYHMLIEGMLALFGQREILHAARSFDVLPGFRAGFTAVTRDESRHVNYGVYALSKAVESGLHDRITERAARHIDAVNDVLVRSDMRIEMPPPEIQELLPPELRRSFRDGWAFPVMQLRKRLRSAGIRNEVLDALERRWWAQTERNLDEYEARFGAPHPARQEERAA